MAIMPFTVIQGHRFRYQSKKAVIGIPTIVINILYRFVVIAAYCSILHTLRFWARLWEA